MTLSEKAAYLKGLQDGLNLDTEKAEGRLISELIEMMSDVSLAIADLDDNASAVSDELDMISDELDAIEEYLDDEDYDDLDDYDEDEDDYADGDVYYEVKCPNCEEVITIDEDMIEQGGIECPNCGEELEFELDPEEEE
jgi:DNA-directed RNA polymerase subunit RPC12/RpoP